MSGGDAAYSFSLTTFSRTGKLLQIEYALNAAQQGKTSLGIRGACEWIRRVVGDVGRVVGGVFGWAGRRGGGRVDVCADGGDL